MTNLMKRKFRCIDLKSQGRLYFGYLNLVMLIFLMSSCAVRPYTGLSGKTSTRLELTEIHAGILQGYLDEEALPNSLELLPPPPTKGSTEWKLDQEKAEYFVNEISEERREQAIRDVDLSFPGALQAYNGVLPFPLTEETTPNTIMILRRTLADAGLSTYSAKNHYQRPRPFMVNKSPVFSPEDEDKLRADGSYPSGHTAIGWAWALILTELFPDQTDAILERGKEFGISRNICNVHWHSDVVAGRTMGAATVARLHADIQFLIDIGAAKKEINSLLDTRKS
jgi:acid phosphatase (class A)